MVEEQILVVGVNGPDSGVLLPRTSDGPGMMPEAGYS
jgi:hypothetical protein